MYKLKNVKKIKTIDTHTEGEPTRLILDKSLKLKGKTVFEKKKFFMKNYDYLRTSILREPRGHKDIFGAVLTESSLGDFGIFFMDNEGYLPMCGHATMGASVALNKLGLLSKSVLGRGKILFETPEGIVSSEINILNKDKITITNVPSYIVKEKVTLNTTKGKISGAVLYSGNYVYIVDPKQVGLRISLKDKKELIEYGMEIKSSLKNLELYDPVKKSYFKIPLIEFSTKIGKKMYKNMAIFGNGQFDRSPCGTGSSAKLTQLFCKNVIGIEEPIVINSVIGTNFLAHVHEVKETNGVKLVVPKISGLAFVTSISEHVMEKEDQLQHGFVA